MRWSLDKIRPADEEIRFVVGVSSLGAVLVASSDKGVVMISLGEDRVEVIADLEQRFSNAEILAGDREDRKLLEQVIGFIESPTRALDLPLDVRGTDFQQRVWRAVQKVPLGRTSTYTDIARLIGAPKAMRAVGTACANCLLSLVVPCHRILRSDGTLAAGPLAEPLLEREMAAIPPPAQASSTGAGHLPSRGKKSRQYNKPRKESAALRSELVPRRAPSARNTKK